MRQSAQQIAQVRSALRAPPDAAKPRRLAQTFALNGERHAILCMEKTSYDLWGVQVLFHAFARKETCKRK